MHAVIVHFDRYPLRAKKARDFGIWREAIGIAWPAHQRVIRNARRGRRGGSLVRWHEDERARFLTLREALRAQREFAAPVVEPSLPAPAEPGLFDALQF